MSDETYVGPPDPVGVAPQSLAERMRRARDKRSEATTEDFPVPSWGDMAWVRLKVLGHPQQRKQVEKNRRVRVPALQELYVAADTIIAATDGFYEVVDQEGSLEPVQTSWMELARGVLDIGDLATERQCFIALVGQERVVPFYMEYIEWLNGERNQQHEDQTRDFPGAT